jgi:transcriptional regulator with GAF, ATPase, and Fis domain
LDPQKKELLEEMQRRIAAGEALPDFADELMVATLQVLSAEKGFIGMFVDDDSTTHSECGIVNLGPEETIEVSSVDFRDHLARGEALQEGPALLVPLGPSHDVKAFFCVKAGRNRAPFDGKDTDFLRALGRLLMPHPTKVPRQPKSRRGANPVFSWPEGIVGRSSEIKDLIASIQHAALTDLNLMVLGESGSGKELVAQAIHRCSRNTPGPLIARNCSQLTETLAEAEIFGYEPRSGISGANPRGAAGWFEMADGGTLFLDEVHSLPPALQDKFLRVLQEKQVWRIGAKSPIHVRVRVVAATDEDPEKALKNGLFRAPFLYRFGATIQVPPLRARADDVPLLAFYFLDKYASVIGSRTRSISHRALRLLTNSDWPGNVRQLEQQIQLAVAKGGEVLFSWDFATLSRTPSREPDDPYSAPGLGADPAEISTDAPKTMDEVEKECIIEALEVTKGNLTKSARLLGYKSRQTLLNKMGRHRIPRKYSVRPKQSHRSL